MINSLTAATRPTDGNVGLGAEYYATVPVTIPHDHVARYVEALGWLCVEVARKPRLLPTFLRILALVPKTVSELQRARRLAA